MTKKIQNRKTIYATRWRALLKREINDFMVRKDYIPPEESHLQDIPGIYMRKPTIPSLLSHPQNNPLT